MGFRVRQRIASGGQWRIRVDVSTPYGQVPSRTISTEALIDTGTPVSIIRSSLAEELGLMPAGMIRITHAANREPIDGFESRADLSLIGTREGSGKEQVITFSSRVVIAPPNGQMEPGLLLGLESSADGVLTIHCREGWWEFVG